MPMNAENHSTSSGGSIPVQVRRYLLRRHTSHFFFLRSRLYFRRCSVPGLPFRFLFQALQIGNPKSRETPARGRPPSALTSSSCPVLPPRWTWVHWYKNRSRTFPFVGVTVPPRPFFKAVAQKAHDFPPSLWSAFLFLVRLSFPSMSVCALKVFILLFLFFAQFSSLQNIIHIPSERENFTQPAYTYSLFFFSRL